MPGRDGAVTSLPTRRAGRGLTGRLRVAVVQNGAMMAGAELWQLHLADATDRMDFRFISMGSGDTSERWRLRGSGVTTLSDPRRPVAIGGLSVGIWRDLRADRPDLVVAHGVKAALAAVPAARSLGIPVAWVRHDPSFAGPLTRVLDRLSDGQIATAGWLLDGTWASRSAVLMPPRMPVGRSREQARARLGLDDDDGRLILGMGCRLTPHKGIDDAICALTHPRAGTWSLAVAGIVDPAHPDELRRLQDLTESLGVDDRVAFLGNVPDLMGDIAAFDAVALLTKAVGRMGREAFGMVVLEAMTNGVPVIAVPPASERTPGCGVAVAPDAPDEVGAALGLLADEGYRRRCGAQASRIAQLHPDAATLAEAMATYLADLADRPGVGLEPTRPISVVTTVLNELSTIDQLLDQLIPQLNPGDEVVVVDGGSTDGTIQVLERRCAEDPRVRLIVAPGAGISTGRNRGIDAAANDVIACTDAGCLPEHHWLAAFRCAIEARPDAELWTGTYRVLGTKPWERALAAASYPNIEELGARTPFVGTYGRLFGRKFDSGMPTGRSMAFTRAAWSRVGGFPEHLATGEDVVFGQRLARRGARTVLVRDAEVCWTQRPTIRENLRMFRAYGGGSGDSLDPRLLRRDLARAAVYPVGLGLLTGVHPVLRRIAIAGATGYLSLPVVRALRGPEPLRTASLVPSMVAARDLAKATGAISALARRVRSPRAI